MPMPIFDGDTCDEYYDIEQMFEGEGPIETALLADLDRLEAELSLYLPA